MRYDNGHERRRSWVAPLLRGLGALLFGVAVTLLSTFAGERSAIATYPDIMGCETGCRVVATGWPLIFVRDYRGMSVVNSADIMEVFIAADLFDWLPFCINVIFWTISQLLLVRLRRRQRG